MTYILVGNGAVLAIRNLCVEDWQCLGDHVLWGSVNENVLDIAVLHGVSVCSE